MDYPGPITFWAVFLLAAVVACAATPIAIKIAYKIGALDIPKDGRRMHSKPMPRFGGLAIFAGATAALAVFLSGDAHIRGIIIGGAMMYILGIIDDLRGMPAKVKLLGQILCAAVVCAFDVRIMFMTNHFGWLFGQDHVFFAGALSWIFTIIWIVGITNTINLIDGLDGLAAGVSAIASLCIAYAEYIHGYYLGTLGMLAIAGAALGFLPFNFHPARIFMGDGGSMFLGFMLASMAVVQPAKGATIVAVIVPVLVLGLPIFDTAFAILRRLINHKPIMEADKGHLHHRIMAIGMGQSRSVMMLYGISAIMGVAAVLFSRDLFVETAGLTGVAAMLVYIFLTDASLLLPDLKGINVRKLEKQQSKRITAESPGEEKSS